MATPSTAPLAAPATQESLRAEIDRLYVEAFSRPRQYRHFIGQRISRLERAEEALKIEAAGGPEVEPPTPSIGPRVTFNTPEELRAEIERLYEIAYSRPSEYRYFLGRRISRLERAEAAMNAKGGERA